MKLLVIVVLCCAAWGLPSDESRIIGGRAALIKDFAYQVRLSCKNLLGQQSICSGSIVNQGWILTAAHCVTGLFDCYVYYGGDIKGQNEISNQVVDAKFYGDSSTEVQVHDIAVLKVRDPIYMKTGFVSNVILESAEVGVVDGVICGWGITRAGDNTSTPDNLQYANVKVASSNFCWNEHMIPPDRYMCASLNSEMGGGGDSGSALVANNKQIGVYIGWGGIKGRNYNAMAFNRVSFYYNWIMSTINA